jgi:hypothetical protein
LLASRVISSTNTLVNQTLYGAVNAVTLVAGQTYYVGAFSASRTIQLGIGGPAFGFPNSVSADLHLVGYGQNTAYGLAFPTAARDGADILLLGPNFLYVEGLAQGPGEGVVLTPPPPVFSAITHAVEGVLLQWNAPNYPHLRYQVQWSPQVSGVWSTFTNVLSASNNACCFLDDGSQSGGPGTARFYRLLRLP